MRVMEIKEMKEKNEEILKIFQPLIFLNCYFEFAKIEYLGKLL